MCVRRRGRVVERAGWKREMDERGRDGGERGREEVCVRRRGRVVERAGWKREMDERQARKRVCETTHFPLTNSPYLPSSSVWAP